MADDLDTDQIRSWRSIITLIVFLLTNIIVLFPFHIPIYVPTSLYHVLLDWFIAWRIISSQQDRARSKNSKAGSFVVFRFPMNFVTTPLIADLFLLAILAIGRQEVHDGTLGADNIVPIDIMAFFLTLAYIAISIDASGLIRYLAFKVLQWGGKFGHRLFFYLYAFFFSLGSFIGNDPIILSGTAFLAYMTRVASNIKQPTAWIHTQFAVANIASAILVSSNPTNLVLAGAFNIKFVYYTAYMVVPVVITAIVLFPFLLYIVFADENLIPLEINLHELSEEARSKRPVNPNIPHARGTAEEEENNLANGEESKRLSLEEIMNPFLDKGGAAFGAVIMTATLITLLALNAASTSSGEHPVFWVTLPAAFVMLCWDLGFGWKHRHETREIARKGREEIELARHERAIREAEGTAQTGSKNDIRNTQDSHEPGSSQEPLPEAAPQNQNVDAVGDKGMATGDDGSTLAVSTIGPSPSTTVYEKQEVGQVDSSLQKQDSSDKTSNGMIGDEVEVVDPEKRESRTEVHHKGPGRPTMVSLVGDFYVWCQETFPTVTAVLAHLPYALIPFAFCMFVLVQALATKGWVAVFAYGWDHWVNKTGTVGSIGGMGFLSVILCNFSGTNIGTTILLSRVIQAWQQIHDHSGIPISDRTFWATVYSMALGVNYGAFSAAFSASLAGLLWRDILSSKHIRVRSRDFFRVNLPIIAIAMTVGCAVLVGEVYIIKKDTPYSLES